MKASLVRITYMLVLVAAVVYTFYTLRGPKGVSAWFEKREEIRRLESENAGLEKENRLKQLEIDRLSDDRAEQELQIRMRLKKVRPNERVYVTGE